MRHAEIFFDKALETPVATRSRLFAPFIFVIALAAFICALPGRADAGALIVGPTTGTFEVGDTFDVQVFLDTEGKSVNAIGVDLHFPPDKLQLVSPKTNVSVITIWTSQPEFNNRTGTIRLQGGIPGGVSVHRALVATLTFRVRSVGNAIVRFADQSKVLLNDGLGTNDLSRRVDALYTLTLPPPAGPNVVSDTHPNPSQWYSNRNITLSWTNQYEVDNYSYILNEEPTSDVDNVGDGARNQITYTNVPDGRHYFHIKALRAEVWGGRTDFAVNIDATPPASFPLEFVPGARTTVRKPVAIFSTTDTLSGLSHYELKIVPLAVSSEPVFDEGDTPFFIEATSPYILPELAPGSYDVIVRPYDEAGNYGETVKRLTIASGFFGFDSKDGLSFGSITVSWVWLLSVLASLVAALLFVSVFVKRRHASIVVTDPSKLPESVQSQLAELKRLKSKYGIIVLLLATCLAGGVPNAYAQGDGGSIVELAPPYITTISENVSNDEIFYVGGKTERGGTEVTIYTQNLSSGETQSFLVSSDTKGDWFYRHNGFLSPGKYTLWVQARVGDVQSPPSSQVAITVEKAAIEFGATRISYEALLIATTLAFLAVISLLIVYIVHHAREHSRKKSIMFREMREAEEAIKRGFAVLSRDIERELETIRKIGLARPMDSDEQQRERELIDDLRDIERRIGKEMFDVERSMGSV